MPKSTYSSSKVSSNNESALSESVDGLRYTIEKFVACMEKGMNPDVSKPMSSRSVVVKYVNEDSDEEGSDYETMDETKDKRKHMFSVMVSLKDMIKAATLGSSEANNKFMKLHSINTSVDFMASIMVSIMAGAAEAYEIMNEYSDKVDITFKSKEWRWAIARIVSKVVKHYEDKDPIKLPNKCEGVCMWMAQHMDASGVMNVDERSIKDLVEHASMSSVQTPVVRVFKALNKIADRIVLPYPIKQFIEVYEKGKYYGKVKGKNDYGFMIPEKIKKMSKHEIAAKGMNKKCYSVMVEMAFQDKEASMDEIMHSYWTMNEATNNDVSDFMDEIKCKLEGKRKPKNKKSIKAEYRHS